MPWRRATIGRDPPHVELAGLRGRRRLPRRPGPDRPPLHPCPARHGRLLPRPPPHPVVGGVPVVPRHRDQRRHDHLRARHGVPRELGVRAVLRRLQPGQARGGLPLHPRLLSARRDDDLRVPRRALRARQPDDGLDLLLRHAACRLRCAAHGGRASRCPSFWAGRSCPRSPSSLPCPSPTSPSAE